MDEPYEKEPKDHHNLHRVHVCAALEPGPEDRAQDAHHRERVSPRSLVQMGASKRAPFRDWLDAMRRLGLDADTEPEPIDDEPSLAELRRPVRHR